MQVIRGYPDPGVQLRLPAVTIGNFDGLHLGHQQVMSSALGAARSRGVVSVACTFEPHTRHVLDPEHAPPLLQTLEQRLRAIEDLGVDVAIVIPFDKELARTPHERFVDEFLVRRLAVGSLHVSEGFYFGRDQAGSTAYLEQRAVDCGFEVARVAPFLLHGLPVSSTRIRQLLAEGRVGAAQEMLGRPYAVVGQVVPGAGRGRRLEAPTANLEVQNGCLPAAGVYVTEALLGEHRFPSVTNIGRRPTFEDDGPLTIEAHLLEYDGSPLRGHTLELAFLDRIRSECRFESAAALRKQISADIRAARTFLSAAR